ncbi:MAG: hypothetical protein AAF409_16245 [Pseudomonadota bacterium]
MSAALEERTASPFCDVVEDALGVLEDERVAFLSGAYDRVEAIVERKKAALVRLEQLIPDAPRTDDTVTAMRRLIAASRRNEQIIQAARQGLAHARRRIAVIKDAARGVVAYAEDGSRIASQADLIGSGKSA